MVPAVNRQWQLTSRPTGQVTVDNFSLRQEPLARPGDGEVLVRTLFVSFDPAMRGWMNEDPVYLPPLPLGSVMPAFAVGQVVESMDPEFAVGDFVSGQFGWQEFAVVRPGGPFGMARVDPARPLSWYLGVLGGTGLTAYFGLLEVGRPEPGDTVVVSGAAGATGSVVCQIAKIKQCRVVAIAGGSAKCRWLTQELNLDAAIDYREEPVGARLGELCPDGIAVYFDNVGGPILEAAIDHTTEHGRIALCGMISQYNAASPPPGPRNLFRLVMRAVRMEGFLVRDFADRFEAARDELAGWIESGRLVGREDVQEGFENIPATFLRLFDGSNVGKQVLKIADP